MKNILVLSIVLFFVFSCKDKEHVPNEDKIPTAIESPLDTANNGWELIASAKFSELEANESQYFFKVKHIEMHQNVADIFITKLNAITKSKSANRWQVDIEEKTNLKISNYNNGNMENFINMKSYSLQDNDFTFVKEDGLYRGNTSYLPTIPTFKLGFAHFDDDGTEMVASISGGAARVVGYEHDFLTYGGFYYRNGLFTIPYKGKVIYGTLDNNINENQILLHQSSDSLSPDPSFEKGILSDLIHPMQVVKTLKYFFEPSLFTHYGFTSSVFKQGDYFYIYLDFRMVQSPEERKIYFLKLNPETLELTKINNDYSNILGNKYSVYLMKDRPGQLFRITHDWTWDKENPEFFNGNSWESIPMFKLKSFSLPEDNFYYTNGRLYRLIKYKSYLHLVSKKI